MRISDWSSDVCSSDLHRRAGHPPAPQDRGRPEVPALSADCARHRLRADAGLTLRATAADDPPAPDKGALSAAPADPLYPHGAPGRVRRLLPRSLLGRSVLIIITPLILDRKSTRLNSSH